MTSIIEVEGEWLVACACNSLFTSPYKAKAMSDHQYHAYEAGLAAAREALGEDTDGPT